MPTVCSCDAKWLLASIDNLVHSSIAQVSRLCCSSIESLFDNDGVGDVSFEVIPVYL